MAHLVLIGLGGFGGAIARYVVDRRVSVWVGGALPWGTFIVNLSGSFVLGVLFALLVERGALPGSWRGPVMIGFIGAYTTFSTLMLESYRLIEDGAWFAALVNLGGSMLLGMVAVVAGVAVGRAVA